jgi:eukaryotic-like serine/threonine-protein kinase
MEVRDGAPLEIPGYEVWGLLGEGGMSEVWLAKHVTLAAPAIVKTIRRVLRDADTHGTAANAILSEARLMARVSSPQIVRALDAGRVAGSGTPYLVQEYVDGLDLGELDRRRRAALGVGLPLWLVCHVMREVCVGLRSAHQAGVIHRDLKPTNVFGAPETGVRLGDFGIAVARGGVTTDAAGTLGFMAPEQFQVGGACEIGRFTDVWGAGATACDLRYGHGPFASVLEIVDPDKPPRLPPPPTPTEAFFQEIVRTMLTKDLRKRPQDIAVPLQHFATLARAIAPPAPAASRLDASTLLLGSLKIRFVVGDIAESRADAIVSSANYQLQMRTGVGDSLRAKGGDGIEEEAMRGGERPLGSCIRTGPGTLGTRHVFHAVSAWNEVSCVGRAFARALLLSDEHGCQTLAVPALGTGAARVGIELCAVAMTTTLRWHAMLGGMRLRELTVVLATEEKRRAFQEIALEGLSGLNADPLTTDVGLPADDVPTSPDAATFLDPHR